MSKRSGLSRISTPVWVAIITVIGVVIAALINNPPPPPPPNPTPIPTSTYTPTSTSTPSLTPTQTFTPTNTPTPLPITCANGFFACVFPQADEGKTFIYKSNQSVNLTVDEVSTKCGLTSELGVKLTYGITQKNTDGAWGVQWKDTIGYLDVSNYINLTFAVKGAAGNETFLIGMKDIPGKPVTVESKNYVTVSSTKWEKVSIPFSKFIYQGSSVNPQALENVSFSFDERHGSGSICIDDIAFTK